MTTLIRQILGVWIALFAALVSVPASSEPTHMSDIDIYGITNTTTEQPNVLIVLDNTANWNNMFEREIKAMVQAFNGLQANRFRVGLMMYTETSAGDSTVDGGYVRAAVRTLDANYKSRLEALLLSLHKIDDKSNGGKAGLTMMEAYRYFRGGDLYGVPYAGNKKNKADYLGNTFGTDASKAIYGLPGNALQSKNATKYESPIQNSCVANYIIFISNGAAQDPSDKTLDDELTKAYTTIGQTRPADITGLTPNDSESSLADEWARFMKASPASITTFTLDVDPGAQRKDQGWTALLKSMAIRSGGEYFKIDSTVNNGEQIVKALDNIFNQILSVNSVFASASLPVSVNGSGTYQNQVFMGMFRPDASNKPRWRGNLKQYRFGYDPTTDTLRLEDSLGQPAITGATGFVSPTAVSYWTQPSSYWINQPQGTPPSSSDSADGEVVEKGGVAQGLRTKYATDANQNTRKIYTCISCSNGADLTATGNQFVTTNSALTRSLLGASSDDEKNRIIWWTRGRNDVDTTSNTGAVELGPNDGTTTVRPSIHGDVLHSRPRVVNYGSSRGVVVFYGSNDGLLRAVNGSQSGTGAGEEMWAFLPEEHLPKLKRLRDNSPEVKLSMTQSTTATARDYFVDGAIGLYQKINTSGGSDKVYIYPSMRRGGRVFYALDVTDPTAPKLLWKKTPTELPILGQTWSEPRVARIRGNSNPVIIMGAGYDPNEDDSTPGTPTMGNAILVLDAFTGTLLRQLPTLRSVPADVSVVDADFDGYVDRAYAADVGGNVYRIDFEVNGLDVSGNTVVKKNPDDWHLMQLAALSTSTAMRKVFYAPDVVFTGQTTTVLVGTGDREKPLTYTSSNALFTLYDTLQPRATPPDTFRAYTPDDLAVVGTDGDMTKGCYIPLSTAGEKVVTAPVTVGGNTYFSTNTPTPPDVNSCSANLGVAKAYAAPLFCKAASVEVRKGGGMPPTAVGGVVDVTYTRTNSDGTTTQVSKQLPFLIGGTSPPDDPCTKNSGLEGCKIKLNVPPVRVRKYWYTEKAR